MPLLWALLVVIPLVLGYNTRAPTSIGRAPRCGVGLCVVSRPRPDPMLSIKGDKYSHAHAIQWRPEGEHRFRPLNIGPHIFWSFWSQHLLQLIGTILVDIYQNP